MKSLGSLPRNRNSDVVSVEVKCEVLAKKVNRLLYLFRIFFTLPRVRYLGKLNYRFSVVYFII